MRLIMNTTKYTDDQVRKMFSLSVKALKTSLKNIDIEFKYIQGYKYRINSGWSNGLYTYGRSIKIRITDHTSMQRILEIILHEIAHHRTWLIHKWDMVNIPSNQREWLANTAKNYVDDVIKQYEEWHKTYTPKEIVKPKKDIQLERYENVLKHVEEKSKKIKRLQNQLKKWNEKKRYYERVLTASKKIEGK